MKNFRVAFVQGRPAFGRAEANLEKGLALAATVAADLVVIPELWSTGYVFSSHAEVAALAEDAQSGATARALAWAARREKRHYIAGFAEVARGRYFNSAMLVGPGGVKAVYRKLHLFEREQEWFERGNLPLEVHAVGPARVGLLVCYDWRFPEVSRVLALKGADVLAHPSNLVFPNAQQAMLTRAIENRVYVVTANRTGTDRRPGGTVPFTGRSQIAAPNGLPMVRATKAGEVAAAADLDLSITRDKRITPLTAMFSNRRPEHYGALVARRGVAYPPRIPVVPRRGRTR
jgi:predicted amidohydrolase